MADATMGTTTISVDASPLNGAAPDPSAGSVPEAAAGLDAQWYDDKGRDTRGRESRAQAFADARRRLDALDLATSDDIEAQAAFIDVVRNHPLFGYDDPDGTRTFGTEAKFGRDNARRLKAALDGSDPDAMLTQEFKDWRALSSEAQADLALSKRGFVQTVKDAVKDSLKTSAPIGPGPMTAPPVATDISPERREAVRKDYEQELFKQNRGLYFAAVTRDLSDFSKDWIQDALDHDRPDGRALWLLPEQDRGYALAAYRIAKGQTDVPALTAGLLDAGTQISGMTLGALAHLSYIARTTGGRAPEYSPMRQSLDAEEQMRAQLEEALTRSYPDYNVFGQAVRGVVGSLPYMAAMSNPVGAPLATLGMANDARKRMILEGVDGNTAAMVGLAVGVVNSQIEKVQWEQMTGGGLTEFELRRLSMESLANNLKRRDLSAVAADLAKGGRHGFRTGVQELAEDVMQDVAEQAGVDLARGQPDAAALSDAFFDSLVSSAPADFGFGAIAGSGLGPSARSAARGLMTGDRITPDAIQEIMRRRSLANAAVADHDGTAEPAASKTARAESLVRELRTRWNVARSGREARRILTEANLGDGTAEMLDQMFRDEALATAQSPAFRGYYEAENLNADISPDTINAIPGFSNARAVSDGVTDADIALADGKTATVRFRSVGSVADANPERFDEQLRQQVGATVWNGLSDAERTALRGQFAARAAFELSDTESGAALDFDGLVMVAAPDGVNGGARMGDLYHEAFHAATLLARRAGVLTDGHVATLRELFGAPGTEGELFAEEPAANGYAAWLAKGMDDRSGAFTALRDFLRRIYSKLFRRPATAETGAWTVDDVYGAVADGRLDSIPESAVPPAAPVPTIEPAPAVSAPADASPVAPVETVPSAPTLKGPDPLADATPRGDGTFEKRFVGKDGAEGVMIFKRVPSVETLSATERQAASDMLAQDAAVVDAVPADVAPVLPSDGVSAFSSDAMVSTGMTPVIEALYQLGGLKSPAQARREASAKGRQLGAEWDGAPLKLGPGWNRFVYGGSESPDTAAQQLHENGLLKDAYPDTLWRAIESDVSAYQRQRAMQREQVDSAKQDERFRKDAEEPTKAAAERNPKTVAAERLKVGDIVHVRRATGGKVVDEKLSVSRVDAETGDVTLDDGATYGRQVIGKGDTIYVARVERSKTNGKPSANPDATRRFSLRVNGNPEDVAAAIAAGMMLRGKPIGEAELSRMLRNMGSSASASTVMDRAVAVSSGYRAEVRQVAQTDLELLDTLRKASLERRYFRTLDAAAAVGFKEGSEEARAAAAMENAKRRTLKAQIESLTGFGAAELEVEYGVDFTAAMLANRPDALRAAAEKRLSEIPADAVDFQAEPLTEAERLRAERAGPPVPRSESQRVAWEELLKLAQQDLDARMQARSDAQRRRSDAAQRNAVDDTDAADGSGGGDGTASSAMVLNRDLAQRVPFEVRSGAHFASIVKAMVQARLSRRQDYDAKDPFGTPFARREFALTAGHILTEQARKLNPSATRETTRIDIDRLTQFERLTSLEGAIERIFDRIQLRMIPETQEALVSRLERDIRQTAGARGAWSDNRPETDRSVESRVERWARTVLSYLRMSDGDMESELDRLNAVIENRMQAVGNDSARASSDRDYVQAVDARAALASYGGLVNKMPGEISDAAAAIMEQLEGSRQRLEERRDEIEVRTQTQANQLAEYFKAPEGRSTPRPNFFSRMTDAIVGLFEQRLRGLGRYARGDVRRRGDAVVADMMARISEASEMREVYRIRQHEKLHAAMEAIYGSAAAAARHLDEAIPEAVWRQFATGTQDKTRLTYGALLQLYVSTLQTDYRTNVAIHGRDKQVEAMRALVDERDAQLVAWLRSFYVEQRGVLDDAMFPLTGVHVLSPSEIYMPVRVKMQGQGLQVKVRAWNPIPSSVSPRVRHALDFDLSADIVGMFMSRVDDTANAVAFSGIGMELSMVLGRDRVQSVIEQHHGREDLNRLLSQLTDMLKGSFGPDMAEGGTAVADVVRSWVSRFALSYNTGSALKQVAAFPALALHPDVRLGSVIRYMADVDATAARELVRSGGWLARYGSGSSEEIANALRQGGTSWIARLYNKGFAIPQLGDQAVALWIGQGIYRSRKAHAIDSGMDEATATRRALSETWSIIEQTQQSSRIENMTAIQRNGGGIGRAMYQFVSSPAQQMAFETTAFKRAVALRGADGSGAYLARVLFINHALVPALMSLASAGIRAALGYERPEDEESYWQGVIGYMLAGPLSGLLFIGAAGEAGLGALLTGKKTFGAASGLPAANIAEFIGTVGLTAHDILTGCDSDNLKRDLKNLLKQTSAPGRQLVTAMENYSE